MNKQTEALEQPAQEPVGYIQEESPNGKGFFATYLPMKDMKNKPVYTHPAQSWQGLSDKEYMVLASNFTDDENMVVDEIGFARAIEQALRNKNE